MELVHGKLSGTHGAGTWDASCYTWSWDMGSYLGHMELGHGELAVTHGAGT